MPLAIHHMAFRCRDSEETRRFYEEVIGLKLVAALELGATKTGRKVEALHTFFQLHDGSHIAFFEAPDQPFEFREQHDFDLHLALEATPMAVTRALATAKHRGIKVRGPADHDFITSVYFRDPNGYVVELVQKTPGHDDRLAQEAGRARARLDAWTRRRKTMA